MMNIDTSTDTPPSNTAGSPEVDLGLLAQRVVLTDHHLHQRDLHARRTSGTERLTVDSPITESCSSTGRCDTHRAV